MPKTTFRLRVHPILKIDGQEPQICEWSEITNITTKETMTLDLSTNVAISQNKQIVFDKPGIITANYGYSFGEHFWMI